MCMSGREWEVSMDNREGMGKGDARATNMMRGLLYKEHFETMRCTI